MRLTVHYDGRVVVTMPSWATERGAQRFLREKKDWLYFQIKENIPQTTPLYNEGIEKYRSDAVRLVHKKLTYFNFFYDFTYNEVRVKDYKSQWGSCTTVGNLNFNYRILFLPERIVDYIVVHELCHLGSLNHSDKFWKLVAKTIPDHKARRRQLRKISFL